MQSIELIANGFLKKEFLSNLKELGFTVRGLKQSRSSKDGQGSAVGTAWMILLIAESFRLK